MSWRPTALSCFLVVRALVSLSPGFGYPGARKETSEWRPNGNGGDNSGYTWVFEKEGDGGDISRKVIFLDTTKTIKI